MIVRHELVFAMLHVDGHQFQGVVIELANQILQRHGVPYDLILLRQMSLLHGILHVVISYGIVVPAVLHHQVMAETAFVDNDMMTTQVLQSLDFHGVCLLMQYAVGEYLDDRLAVMAVIVVKMGIHTTHQVGMSASQVVEGILRRLQLDDVRYVELLTQHLEQVDVVTHRLAVLVQESIGPEVPCILVNQRMFLCKCAYGVSALRPCRTK